MTDQLFQSASSKANSKSLSGTLKSTYQKNKTLVSVSLSSHNWVFQIGAAAYTAVLVAVLNAATYVADNMESK